MKQKTIRLFFAVFVLSFISLTNLFAQDKLVGTWERTGDDLAGVKIKVFKTGDSFRGKIVLVTQSMIGGCFKVGEIKWMNILKAGDNYYELDDLTKSPECNSWYTNKYIEFTDDTHITITATKIDPTTAGSFQTWTKISDE